MTYKSSIIEKIRWSLTMDLVQDYRQGTFNELARMGYTPTSLDCADIELFNVRKMIPQPIPRKVIYSAKFICPTGYHDVLSAFAEKVEKGESLKPFLSEKVEDSTNNDLLLNDWNIYHFHFTMRFHPDGRAKRHNLQLFAYLTDDQFYMLQVYEHPNERTNPLGYCKQEMIRIIHNNWPELIAQFRVPGVTAVSPDPTDENYKRMRDMRAIGLVDAGEGVFYALIGGGYASDGTSVEAVKLSNHWHNKLKLYELHLLKHVPELIASMENLLLRKVESQLSVKFMFYRNRITYLLEENNGVVFKIPDDGNLSCIAFSDLHKVINQ